MAHANGPEAVGRCLAAGAATIEHGYFMGRRNLEHLADAGVTWVPTIAPMNVLSRNLEDPVHKANAARIVADQIDALARAKDLGAAVAAGTDAGAPGVELGPSLYEELGFFRQAGWDAADALTAACRGDLVQSPGLGRLTPAADAQVNIFNLAADGSADLSRPPDTVVVAGRVETGPENGSC
jgi:imidazolonepropionase-like amidohydrolase